MSFPVENKGYSDFKEYLAIEGFPVVTGLTQISFIWGGEAFRLSNGVSNVYTIDNTMYLESVTLSSSRPMMVDIFTGTTSAGIPVLVGSVFVIGSQTLSLNMFKKIDTSAIFYQIRNIPDINPSSILATVNQNSFSVIKASGLTVVNANLKTFSTVITLTNLSGVASSGSLVISDILPIGCDFISAVGTGFTLSQTGKNYTMTTSDVIANGATKTYVLTARTSVTTDLSVSLQGVSISNDIDLSLRPSVWAGTSITNGTGANSFRNNYTMLVKKWLSENRDLNVRNVNKAIAGSTTNIMEDYRVFNNWYDFKQDPKFLWIEHGVNDIGQSIPNATSVSNVTKMINYYRKKYPTCYIIILAPFPVGVVNTEAGLVTYRNSMQNLVNSYSTEDKVYLKYIPGTGSAWNPTTQSATYTTDNVHVNNAGRLLITNAITDFITANNLTFN
jgi:lysophospholipase L1-like esterase